MSLNSMSSLFPGSIKCLIACIIALSSQGVKLSLQNETDKRLPKLVVFDLDYTLWPINVTAEPQFEQTNGVISDVNGKVLHPFDNIPEILQYVKGLGCKIGIAYQANYTREANLLLHWYKWDKYIDYKQILPGVHTTHFANLKKESGIDYKDMLFFDDEIENYFDVGRLGVTYHLVLHGVNMTIIEDGFKRWRRNNPIDLKINKNNKTM
ncbi:hypothetical protein WDU94_001823 [Cyamophila willieti]